MRVEIENIKLADSIGVLDTLTLKGLKSINRTRLKNVLVENLRRVADEEKQLKREHSNLDDNGDPVIKDGKYDIKDMEAFQKDLDEFYKVKVIIDGGDSQVYLKSVKQSLEESEVEWEGKEADAFAYLYDAFKNDKGDAA